MLEIKELSKKFQINSNIKPYLSLRENLFAFLKRSSRTEEFWALKDINFDVMPGDTIGIVGKNGAGKSTLLKILSKITPPTSGKIICRGRIASLLEVGTGFHPELNGRENIFMNGSILGMRRAEILKNFDAIVDFSGVEKFIDTPLKHYSSGMQLRLAFAVAAFLENEILIIDEVLAVGDAEFQKKCMGKMGEVSKSGRTILFVSHNMSAIAQLCKTGLLLANGGVKKSGTTNEVITEYINLNNLNNSKNFNPAKRLGPGLITITNLLINKMQLQAGEKMTVEFILSKAVPLNKINLDFRIDNNIGEKCLWISDKLSEREHATSTVNKIVFEIPKLNLNVGYYNITYCLFLDQEAQDLAENCLSFEVLEGAFYPNWKFPPSEQANVLVEFKIRYE
ncbi:MAG: ATP-binding cassette domain-containing protein [Bacteroidetes bacterium]|nr:ATP-binding cassette domain-containing protein [Bacteroidota bacterium]